MKFTKMQGLGNDYIYVDCFREKIENPSSLAIRLSDRHFGIGSDGLILICPSEKADVRMEMYNADGSRGKMCGNGIRCVARYAFENALTDRMDMRIETDAGIKELTLTVSDGRVQKVRVDMGTPVLDPAQIPVSCPGFPDPSGPVIGRTVSVGGRDYRITCVSMGNPHCVTAVEDVERFPIEETGPLFERHEWFPDRINTEFVQVTDRASMRMRVWERGAGETLACGTGACAAVVAGVLNGWTEDTVTVHLPGGDLLISWDREKNTVLMTGPAETVFEGEIEI